MLAIQNLYSIYLHVLLPSTFKQPIDRPLSRPNRAFSCSALLIPITPSLLTTAARVSHRTIYIDLSKINYTSGKSPYISKINMHVKITTVTTFDIYLSTKVINNSKCW